MAKLKTLDRTREFVGVPVYLSPDEAANVLHVTRRTVYEWLRTGQLEGYRPSGRWLISTDQIKTFVARRKPQTMAEARQVIYDRAAIVTNQTSQVAAPAASPPVSTSPVNRAERRRQQKRR